MTNCSTRTGFRTPCQVKVFALLVTRQSESWPESEQRIAQWVEPGKAASLVHEQGLKTLITAFAKRIAPASAKAIDNLTVARCPAVVGGPSAGLSRPRPPNSRRKRAVPPAEVAPKPYDAGGRLATAGGLKIRLTRRSPHPGHIIRSRSPASGILRPRAQTSVSWPSSAR